MYHFEKALRMTTALLLLVNTKESAGEMRISKQTQYVGGVDTAQSCLLRWLKRVSHRGDRVMDDLLRAYYPFSLSHSPPGSFSQFSFFLKNSRFSLFVESDSYGWGSPAFSRFHTQIEHHMLSVMDTAIDGKTLYKWSSLCS